MPFIYKGKFSNSYWFYIKRANQPFVCLYILVHYFKSKILLLKLKTKIVKEIIFKKVKDF